MADDRGAPQAERRQHAGLVPNLQLSKVPAGGNLRGSSRGHTSRPFTTSSQWPHNMQVPQHGGALTDRAPPAEYSLEDYFRSGSKTERHKAGRTNYRGGIIPDISNINFHRGSTPKALYSRQFGTALPGTARAAGQGRLAGEGSDMFGNPTASNPRRASYPAEATNEWKKMAVRISGSVDRMDEIKLVGEAVQALLGRHAALHVHWNGNQPANYVEMATTEKPSSRKQAELLTGWLEAQILALTGALPDMCGPLAAGWQADTDAAGIVHAGQHFGQTELAKRLVSILMEQPPQTFFHNHGFSLSVEGFGLPNDARFMRALLEVTSVAAAATIHQVAMHCHERGQLLAQVWNIHTSLMDMELSQLRFQVRVLSDEKEKYARQLSNANFYIRTGREKDDEIDELFDKNKRLKGELAIKEQELDKVNLENIRLQALIESYGESGLSLEEIQDLQMELIEMQSDKDEAEKTRDVALTALFAGVEKSLTVGKGLQEIRDSTFGKLGFENRHEIEQVFNRVEADLKKITAMEDMVDSKMNVQTGELKGSNANFVMLMKARTAAKKMKGIGKTLVGKLKAQAQAGNPLDEMSAEAGSGKGITAPNIAIEDVVQDMGVSVIPEIMLDADMADVPAMSDEDMYSEIQRLRERENTLLYTLNTLLEERRLQEAEAAAAEAPSSPSRASARQGAGRGGPKKGKGNKGRKGGGKAGKEGAAQAAEAAGVAEEDAGEAGGDGEATPEEGGTPRDTGGGKDSPLPGSPAERGVSFGAAQPAAVSSPRRGSTRAESMLPRNEGKKDTIIMMMRALVAGRQQEVEARRLRTLKTNKSMARQQTNAKQTAQEELVKQLEERATHAEKLLEAYKHVHNEYAKLWNVMQSGSSEQGGLVEPGDLLAPEQMAEGAPQAQSSGDSLNKGAAVKRKTGAAQKARKALAAEAFAKQLGGKSAGGLPPKSKSRRLSKLEGGEAATSAAAGTIGSQGSSPMDKKMHFESDGKDAPKRPKTAGGEAVPAPAGRTPSGRNLGGMFKGAAKRNKTFNGEPDGGEGGGKGGGGGGGGGGATLGSMLMKSVRTSPFACKDTALKEAMFKYKSLKPRAKDWVVRIIDKLYEGKASQDAKLLREGEELVAMPDYLFSHLQAQYGAKSLVQEYTASIIITMRQFLSEDIRLQSFARFLSQEWDTPVLSVFLEGAGRATALGAMAQPCCEFPDTYTPGRGLPGWVCTWKAMAISDMLLGSRSPACRDGFHKILHHFACPIEPAERARYFWSPALSTAATEAEREAAAAAEEAARGQEMSKLSVPRFLDCLCAEYNRVEGLLEEVVPMLFKDHDTDFSGFLNRKEVDVMLRSLDGAGYKLEELNKVWDLALQYEEASNDEAGHESLSGGIGVHAFLAAVRRTDAVRRYIRLERTPPPPPLMADEHKESQSKMLYLIVERHWRAFEDSVDRILESGEVDTSESALRGQMTKMAAEQDGARRAQMFVNLLKTLCDIMLVKIQRQCNPSILSNVFDPSMEPNLEKVEKAVKVLYNWKTLLEDDTKSTAALLDPGSGLVARAKAVKDWVSQSKAFVEYKENMQRQAAVILQRKFAHLWWKKRQRHGKGTVSQRSLFKGQPEAAIPVAHVLKFLKASNEE